MEFREFPKMARLSRQCIITEKLDGTNAQVFIERVDAITEEIPQSVPRLYVTRDGIQYIMCVGSRSRWISPDDDNFGFARWAYNVAEELILLGPGRHFGEWWGSGIQRGYNLSVKRFSLFNVERWGDPATRPVVCGVVPTIYQGMFTTQAVEESLESLRVNGSFASPGFMRPEGVVVFHTAGNVGFKKTLEKDEEPKSKQKA